MERRIARNIEERRVLLYEIALNDAKLRLCVYEQAAARAQGDARERPGRIRQLDMRGVGAGSYQDLIDACRHYVPECQAELDAVQC